MTDYPEMIANDALDLVKLFDRHHIDIHAYTFDRSTKLNHVWKIAPQSRLDVTLIRSVEERRSRFYPGASIGRRD